MTYKKKKRKESTETMKTLGHPTKSNLYSQAIPENIPVTHFTETTKKS